MSVVAISIMSNIQWMVGLDPKTQVIVSMVLCLIPTIVMVLLNGGLYRQINRLLKVDQFASARKELKKSLFEARLTNLIASIFICAQVVLVIYYSLFIVSLFSFCVLFKSRNYPSFSVPLQWRNSWKSPWESFGVEDVVQIFRLHVPDHDHLSII